MLIPISFFIEQTHAILKGKYTGYKPTRDRMQVSLELISFQVYLFFLSSNK